MCVAMYMLLSPDSAVQSGYSESLQKELLKVRETLFSIVVNHTTPSHIVASLLKLLVYVNSAVSCVY